MALTKTQENAVIHLWINTFASCDNVENRKKIYLEFAAEFGNGIADWKQKGKAVLSNMGFNDTLLTEYDKLASEEKDEKFICDIRMLEENDFEQVKEILKNELSVFIFDENTMRKFINSKYSYVACDGEQIFGVVLADSVSKIYYDEIWIEALAVANNLQGYGIGKKLFDQICKIGIEEKKYNIKLYTERNRESYHIYKHWGMKETNGVHMEMYCF